MRWMRMVWWVPGWIACGGSATVGPGGPTAEDGGGAATGTGASGGHGGSDDALATFCEAACETTADGACLAPSDCLSACLADGGSWSEPTKEAFATCAATDPLCFITLEGCMLGQLDPADKTFVVDGVEFDAYEGDTAHVIVDGTDVSDALIVQNGSFHFEWGGGLPAWDVSGRLILLYVDGDQSGSCDPAPDFTHAGDLLWNGSFDAPVYSVVLEPSMDSDDWVCGSF